MRGFLIASLLCLALQPRAAHAQSPDEEPAAPESAARAAQAKRLFDAGVEQLAAEHWDAAEALFRRSVELVPRASSLYNLALSLFSLGRFEECAQLTQRVLDIADGAEQATYREYAGTLHQRALGGLAATTQESDPEVAPTPAPEPQLAPTPAQAASANEGTPPLVHADSPSPADREASSGPAAGWFVLGGGALLLAGALVTGLLANASDHDFTSQCPSLRDCDRDLMSLGKRTQHLAIATDILLATGVAATGTGVTLLIVQSASEPRPSARAITGAGLALHGRLP